MGCSDRNQRIILYQPTQTADDYGGQKTEWQLYKSRWAQVLPPNFREQQALGTPMSREQIEIKLQPADKIIKRGWKIEWQGNNYLVDTVDNTYRERTLVVVHCLNAGV